MISRLKVKFVALAMTALFVLLAAMIAGMNISNYHSILSEADRTLAALSQSRGEAPNSGEHFRGVFLPFLYRDAPYEPRFFSALLDSQGQVLQTDTSHSATVETREAASFARLAFARGESRGFVREYRFLRIDEGTAVRIIFLNCGEAALSFRRFLTFSVSMALVGYVLFFFVILFFSDRFLKPVTESYEKQKRFITDAGHEIKTPLSIIQANADVLELEYGRSEWLDGIQTQIQRLSALTAELIYLSRLEEETAVPMIEFPFSDVVSETALSFQALAQTQGKRFRCDIAPMLSYVGNEKAIRQLVNILMDNALKYAPEQGDIRLTAGKQGRQLKLTVFNTTREPVTKELLDHLFERFYRGDASHSSEISGYGIGLSIAQAITAAHSGKITADSKDGHSLEITVQLPA